MGRTRILLAAALAGALLLVAPPASAQEAGEAVEIGHAEEECIHLLEEGGTIDQCQEAPNPILPELNEIIWGSLAFALLFAGLAKFGFPAVKKAMDDRTDRIRRSLDEAEAARAEAVALRDEHQRQVQDARSQSAVVIDEARQQADAVRRDLIERAEAEATQLRQRNAEMIDAERARVMSELQGQVAVLAIDLAERVVESNLDRTANLRLIENYINSLEATGSGANRG